MGTKRTCSVLLWAVGCMLAFSAAAQSAPATPEALPPYMNFLSSCTALLTRSMPVDASLSQEARLGVSSVACHCAYEQLEPQHSFTPPQFKSALSQCVARMKINPSAFVAEYVPRVRASIQANRPSSSP